MEGVIEKKLIEAMSKPKAQGVVCTDMQGLCLGHKGKGNESLAGPIAALCDEAAKQWPALVRLHQFRENCLNMVLRSRSRSTKSNNCTINTASNFCKRSVLVDFLSIRRHFLSR